MRRFSQVDVFGSAPFGGNPLAVVHDATGLDAAAMAAFARWTNLSETTFLFPAADPTADYRVRIFTPGGELPFAGHPTLGSAAAWLAAGHTPRREGELVQECGIGLVHLRRSTGRWAFAAPRLVRSEAPAPAVARRALDALGVEPGAVVECRWLDNGVPWLGVLLLDAATVLDLHPDLAAMGDLKVGVAGLYPTADPGSPGGPTPSGGELADGGTSGVVEGDAHSAADGGTARVDTGLDLPDVEVRAFAPGFGVPEDPVTGSLNAGLARWLIPAGVLPERYVAAQGTAIGRAGRVYVESTGQDTWIGGETAVRITGRIDL